MMVSQEIFRLKFKKNGEVKKLAEVDLEKDIQPGYQADFDVWTSVAVPAETFVGLSFNIKF